jgi:hypothetical protein
MKHPSISRGLWLAPLALAVLHAPAHASCGAAFCSVNSDWASETLGLGEGSVFDLRYENIRQDQPRAGSRRVAVGEIPAHHDEVSTRNQNLLVNYSRSFASGWGFTATLPLVDREHLHIHNHRGAQLQEEWNFQGLGDMRLVGRYQRAVGDQEQGTRSAGLLFGVKLPTGRTGVTNDAGAAAERSLQPGTGTTDAILGAFYHHQLPRHAASWFAQVQYQQALNSHADFKPGGQFSLDLGVSRRFTDKFSGLLQLNAVAKQRDSGAQAEPADSGGRSVFLSPGVGYDVSEALRLYAFYQHPLYQDVHGVQLTASRAFTVGLARRF